MDDESKARVRAENRFFRRLVLLFFGLTILDSCIDADIPNELFIPSRTRPVHKTMDTIGRFLFGTLVILIIIVAIALILLAIYSVVNGS